MLTTIFTVTMLFSLSHLHRQKTNESDKIESKQQQNKNSEKKDELIYLQRLERELFFFLLSCWRFLSFDVRSLTSVRHLFTQREIFCLLIDSTRILTT